MEISKLIFSPETKEKMNRGLNSRGKSKVLWSRLKEVSDSGKLAMCKSRREVAQAVGYPQERMQAGYLWVAGLVKQGKLKETIMGIDRRGYMEYDYKIVEQPVVVKKENKMTKKLSKRAKGQIKWGNIVDASEDGRLDKCRTRRDLAKLAGYQDNEMHSGYSWVTNMLGRGHIVETKIGGDERGVALYSFKIGTPPNYSNTTPNRKQPASQIIERASVPTSTTAPTSATAQIIITYGELKVELNNFDAETLKDILVELINKVKE